VFVLLVLTQLLTSSWYDPDVDRSNTRKTSSSYEETTNAPVSTEFTGSTMNVSASLLVGKVPTAHV
jgi:hypothetical protein